MTAKAEEKKPDVKVEAKPPEPPKAPLNIWQAIPAITGDVAPITKSRKNEQQGYSFRGIDDVYAALNLLLAKHGVCILPELLDSKHEQAGTTKSGSAMWRHTVKVRYHLVASDGSKLTADFEGEGMDTGDKATPKAYSTAYKTMAFEVFCIPTGEKVDSEEESPEVVDPKAPPPVDEDQSAIVADEFRAALDAAKALDEVLKIGAGIAKASKDRRLTTADKEALKPAFAARKKALTPAPTTEQASAA